MARTRTPLPNGRKALTANLEPEDYDAWRAAANKLGVTITGLVTAIAATGTLDKLARRTDIAEAARQVDNTRRARPGNKS